MTWTTRIIAILNIIVAGVLFYYVGQSAYLRAEYTYNLKNLRETRDGLGTVEWFAVKLNPEQRKRLVDSMKLTDELLERLPAPEAQELRELQTQKEGEEQRLKDENRARTAQGLQPIPIPHRAESDYSRRDAMGRLVYDPVNRLGQIVAGPAFLPFEIDENALLHPDPAQREFRVKVDPAGNPILRQPSDVGNPVVLTVIAKPTGSDARRWEDLQKMALFFGFEGLQQMYRESHLLHHATLSAEESAIMERKAALMAIQERYQRDLARLRGETSHLARRLEEEKRLLATVDRENDERRSELTRIYSELGEAFAAREAAQGRFRDAERQLQDARDDIRQLTQENQRFLEAISDREAERGKR